MSALNPNCVTHYWWFNCSIFYLISCLTNFTGLFAWSRPICFSKYNSALKVGNIVSQTTSIMTFRDWIKYFLSSVFIFLALVMLWRRYTWKRRQLEAFKIVVPPSKNAVEQLLTLQEAITQVESLIQSGNIILLKTRALLFAVVPQVLSFYPHHLLLIFSRLIDDSSGFSFLKPQVSGISPRSV